MVPGSPNIGSTACSYAFRPMPFCLLPFASAFHRQQTHGPLEVKRSNGGVKWWSNESTPCTCLPVSYWAIFAPIGHNHDLREECMEMLEMEIEGRVTHISH